MAHTRGVKGVKTHRFLDLEEEQINENRRTEKRTLPVLLRHGEWQCSFSDVTGC